MWPATTACSYATAWSWDRLWSRSRPDFSASFPQRGRWSPRTDGAECDSSAENQTTILISTKKPANRHRNQVNHHSRLFYSYGGRSKIVGWPVSSFGRAGLTIVQAGVRSPSSVAPLRKEPSTQFMGQCCCRPRWPKNCDCALCSYVLYHAVVSCSHARASLCFVCCDSCVVNVRAFTQ